MCKGNIQLHLCRDEASNPGTWTGSEITFGQSCFPYPPLAYYLYLRPIPYQSLPSYLLNHPRGKVELVSAVQQYLYYISSATLYRVSQEECAKLRESVP